MLSVRGRRLPQALVWLVISFWLAAILVGSGATYLLYSVDTAFERSRLTGSGIVLPSRLPRPDTCAYIYKVSQPRDYEFAFLIEQACLKAEARARELGHA